MKPTVRKRCTSLWAKRRLHHGQVCAARSAVSHCALAFLFLVPLANSPTLKAQEATVSGPMTATIVEGMQRHERLQSNTLQTYKGVRHYSVTYKGFAKTIAASMDVEVEYDVSSGKSFRIVSQKGSGMLCEKVLKRALDSEREASLDKSTTALNGQNYRFNLIGNDRLEERPVYVLSVDPISPSKFLYKGKIWVDAADFAVAKMEVQPAKNPSFWISRTLIHHTNHLTNGFWLPEQNQSETKVRIGGTATMLIEYQSYRITAAPGYSSTPPEAGSR